MMTVKPVVKSDTVVGGLSRMFARWTNSATCWRWLELTAGWMWRMKLENKLPTAAFLSLVKV